MSISTIEQRDSIQRHLVLIERAAHNALQNLALGVELAAEAAKPKLALADGGAVNRLERMAAANGHANGAGSMKLPSGDAQSAQQRAMAQQCEGLASAMLQDLFAQCNKLGAILNGAADPGGGK